MANRLQEIRAILGSGDNLCTAVVAENPDNGYLDFIADIFPVYVRNNLGEGEGKYHDIGVSGHLARLHFLKHVFADMEYLLSLVE